MYITILYLCMSLIYILLVCLDGEDVKPKWKQCLADKLGVKPNIEVRYKPLEYLERVLTLAKEAYASYMNNGLILSMVNFGDKYTRILVIFEKDGVRSQQEFDLREQRTYVDIADFIGNGYTIVSVIRQSDNVNSEKFIGEKGERSHSIPIYDGDVMLCYVNKPEFWSSDWRNSGLYICESGSYHRLLYTPNKGYVRHGEPDVDEDFTLGMNPSEVML